MKRINFIKKILASVLIVYLFGYSSCKYSFKESSGAGIPPEVKNVKVHYFENKARIVNPNLSQQLTDKLRQKVVNQTRLVQTNADDADYDISGYISDYNVTTSGISNQQTSTNRLNVSVHLVFKNRKDEKKNFEADLSRSIDFNAQKSLSEEESRLTATIVQNLVDEIFNRVFSDW